MILNRRCYILRCSQQWGISWNINWAGMMAAPCSLLVLLVAFGTNQLMNQSLRRQLGWNGDASSIHAPTTHLLNRTSVKYTFQHMPLNVYPCRLMAQFFLMVSVSWFPLQATVVTVSSSQGPHSSRAAEELHCWRPNPWQQATIAPNNHHRPREPFCTTSYHLFMWHMLACVAHVGPWLSWWPRDIWIWISFII